MGAIQSADDAYLGSEDVGEGMQLTLVLYDDEERCSDYSQPGLCSVLR